MAKGDPVQSPWSYEDRDIHGLILRATFSFNNTTRALTGAVVFRDPGCLKTTVWLGLGPDGTPNTADANHTFVIPDGTTNISAGQMAARGFNTIEDVLATQITAGP